MADDNSGLMAEFEEFLKAKQEKEASESADEDFEIEIFDKEGNGVRTRRSHAKPFLQRMGIDVDPEPPAGDEQTDGKKKPAPKGKQAQSQAASGVARKYFVKK